MRHLETLIPIDEWDLSVPAVVPSSPVTTVSSGSITTSAYAPPSPIYSSKTGIVTGSLGDFFANVFSAFDVFAQIVNIVYFPSPISEDLVSFDRIVNSLPSPPLNKDSIKMLLEGCQKSPLNILANKYRNCSTHRMSLQFKVTAEIEPLSVAPALKVAAISLPDDPEVSIPTYSRMIEARIFSKRVLKHALSVIDRSYGIMENTLLTSDQIPV